MSANNIVLERNSSMFDRIDDLEIYSTPNCNVCHHRQTCSANKLLESGFDIDIREIVTNKGDEIIVDNNEEKFVYFLKSGSVQESIQHGIEPVMIYAFYLPWSVIGVSSAYDVGSMFQYIALERTRLCKVSASSLRDVSLSRPDLFFDLLKTFGQISQNEKICLTNLRKKSATAKVADFLLQIYRKKETNSLDAAEIILTMPRSSISCFLGLSIEGISRVLKKLDDINIIAVFNRRITIKDIQNLEKISLSESDL